MPVPAADRLRRLIETRSRPVEEATEVEVTDLPPDRQKLVKKLKLRPLGAWDGIHGFIVDFQPGPPAAGSRLTKKFLEILTRDRNFRWIEARPDHISVGM